MARMSIASVRREPTCLAREHNWQSPHEIVGGCKESPGVRGHGGGVIICEVCMHCGCERETDTWDQDPETGRQGLTSVRYTPGKWAVDVAEDEVAECIDAAKEYMREHVDTCVFIGAKGYYVGTEDDEGMRTPYTSYHNTENSALLEFGQALQDEEV